MGVRSCFQLDVCQILSRKVYLGDTFDPVTTLEVDPDIVGRAPNANTSIYIYSTYGTMNIEVCHGDCTWTILSKYKRSLFSL